MPIELSFWSKLESCGARPLADSLVLPRGSENKQQPKPRCLNISEIWLWFQLGYPEMFFFSEMATQFGPIRGCFFAVGCARFSVRNCHRAKGAEVVTSQGATHPSNAGGVIENATERGIKALDP